MRTWLMMTVVMAGLSGPLCGAVIFMDDFESETVGEAPSQWTASSQWVSFYVEQAGNPGKNLSAGQWSGSFTVDSKETFTAAEMTAWTLSFDHKSYQQNAQYDRMGIMRTPGNFLIRKDQWRGIVVYNGNGDELGSTDSLRTAGSGTDESIWTHYTMSYDDGVLTVTGSNENGTVSSSFNGAVPDFSTHDQITSASILPDLTHRLYLDNVVLDAVPEPTTLALLGFGGLLAIRRKR